MLRGLAPAGPQHAAGWAAADHAAGDSVRSSRTYHVALLLALAGLLFFLDLGGLRLTDGDEGKNAEAAREMFESGDWIRPTLNAEPRFAKPVFVYWLMSGAYRLFGVSEFAARFPSALFGGALILMQYAFLAYVRGRGVALLGALMLVLNVEIVTIGRLALTDSVLIFFTTLALFGFWLGLHGANRRFFWLFYVGMALGALSKGPVGVLVPLIAAVPYLALTRRFRLFWRTGYPLAGIALFLALSLPWYAVMLATHGARYASSAHGNTVRRFLNPIDGHDGTIAFYVPFLLLGFFPWSAFLPSALYRALRNRPRGLAPDRAETAGDQREEGTPTARDLELFAALWVVGVFLFFSLSATRLPHYIGPLFPAAAILAASYWHRGLIDPATPGIRGSFIALVSVGALVGICLVSFSSVYSAFVNTIAKEFPAAPLVSPGSGPVTMGAAMLIGMGVVGYYALRARRRAAAFWAAAATITVIMVLTILVMLPRFNRYFVWPMQELALVAGANLGPDDRLIVYGPRKPSLMFYARHTIIAASPRENKTLRSLLTDAQTERTAIILPARLRSKLPDEAGRFVVVREQHGYVLIANRPITAGGP